MSITVQLFGPAYIPISINTSASKAAIDKTDHTDIHVGINGYLADLPNKK